MVSRVNPALNVRIHFLIFAGTVDGLIKTNDLLFQSRNGGDRLKCGTRCFLGLSRVVVKRQGQIFLQLFHIRRVRASGQAVVVVAWVGNQCPHLSGVDIGDDHTARTRIQRQLGRSQLNILNLAADELEGVFLTVGR